MHRRELFRRAAVLGAGFAFRHSADVPSLDLSPDTRERIHKASTAGLAMQRRDWEQGTLAQAFLEAGLVDQLILLTKAAIVQRVRMAASPLSSRVVPPIPLWVAQLTGSRVRSLAIQKFSKR
jgi:hypothetical protein